MYILSSAEVRRGHLSLTNTWNDFRSMTHSHTGIPGTPSPSAQDSDKELVSRHVSVSLRLGFVVTELGRSPARLHRRCPGGALTGAEPPAGVPLPDRQGPRGPGGAPRPGGPRGGGGTCLGQALTQLPGQSLQCGGGAHSRGPPLWLQLCRTGAGAGGRAGHRPASRVVGAERRDGDSRVHVGLLRPLLLQQEVGEGEGAGAGGAQRGVVGIGGGGGGQGGTAALGGVAGAPWRSAAAAVRDLALSSSSSSSSIRLLVALLRGEPVAYGYHTEQ